jgi:hypothetical protein
MSEEPTQRDLEIRAAIDELRRRTKTCNARLKRYGAGSNRTHPRHNLRVYGAWLRSKAGTSKRKR